MRGTHLAPADFHAALANPNSVVIDVRNFNETLIGKFAPPTAAGVAMDEKVLDPCMRKSTGTNITNHTSSFLLLTYLNYLPIYLSTYLPTYLPAYLPTYL